MPSILRRFLRLALTITVLVAVSATALTQFSSFTSEVGAWRIGRPSGPVVAAARCWRSCGSPLKAVLMAAETPCACAWRRLKTRSCRLES